MKGGLFLKGLVPGDLESCGRAGSFLQSDFWGSFKARFGWNARPFLVSWNSAEDSGGGAAEKPGPENAKPLLVIRRRLGAGVSFSYVPWGPELPDTFPAEARYAALAELAGALKAFLPRETAFIRFDPPWYTEGAGVFPPPPGPPFVRAGADVQPPDTVLVSLDQTMDALLDGMKPKWRYNARLALRKGVVVRRADEAGLDIFYSLLKETARRDGIAVHGIPYYQTLFSHCGEYGKNRGNAAGNAVDLRLYIAEHEGSPLAAIVVLLRGSRAVYLYGASSDRKRDLMAPYALQVKAMEDAMASGCGEYDLFGIPPVSAEEDPDHPMAGLYRFKTGFGGRVVHRPGSWDYPLRPLAYRLFRAAESLRKRLRTVKKNAGRAKKEKA